MKIWNKYLLLIILLVVIIVFFIFKTGNSNTSDSLSKGDLESWYEEVCIKVNCKTYHSNSGFSFRYPDYMFILEYSENSLAVFLPSIVYKADPGNGIKIDINKNTERVSAEEWVFSKYPDFDQK